MTSLDLPISALRRLSLLRPLLDRPALRGLQAHDRSLRNLSLRGLTLRRPPLSAAGWSVLAGGIAGWVAGYRFGWLELMDLAAAALLALLLAFALTRGRLRARVTTTLDRPRVTAGESALAQLEVGNDGRRAMPPVLVELQIGAGAAQFDVLRLAPGTTHTELVEIPTVRRGVIPLGPARTLRVDPLGLVRRSAGWPDVTLLHVHPLLVHLGGSGTGLLRDLEGRRTDQVSTSDVELHTLRDYVPGDDRRYVHWRTSARSGRLMVRQFVDTRRTHVAVLTSGRISDYADEAEFELAVSVASSLSVRVLRDDQELTALCAGRILPTTGPQQLLDGTSAVEWGGWRTDLVELSGFAQRRGGDATVAVLVAGSGVDWRAFRAAAARWPMEVRVLALRVDRSSPAGFRPVGALPMVSLQRLDELPRLLGSVSLA